MPLLDNHAAIQVVATDFARGLAGGNLDLNIARQITAILAVALRTLPRPAASRDRSRYVDPEKGPSIPPDSSRPQPDPLDLRPQPNAAISQTSLEGHQASPGVLPELPAVAREETPALVVGSEAARSAAMA